MDIYVAAHPDILLNSLLEIIKGEPGFNLIGNQAEYERVRTDLQHLTPEVVVICMSLDEAYELTDFIPAYGRNPEAKVLVYFPQLIDAEWEYDLYNVGAVNVLHGTDDPSEIIRSIYLARKKERWENEGEKQRVDFLIDVPLESVLKTNNLSLDDEIMGSTIIPDEIVYDLWVRYKNLRYSIGNIPIAFLEEGVQNPNKTSAFQVSSMLDAFDRITIEDGYVLDYVYGKRGGGGEPFLYARKMSEKPLETLWDFCEMFGFRRPDLLLGVEPTVTLLQTFLPYLSFEDSHQGYLHFALFVMLSRRFYLYDHSNYNDRIYLFTRAAVIDAIRQFGARFDQNELHRVLEEDPNPIHYFTDNCSVVRLLNYEMNRGFSYLNVYCAWPNAFYGLKDEVILQSQVQTLY